jgi:hypothetical protein
MTNVSYIQYFRHPSKMRLESGYFFVSFSTAVTFLGEMTASSLSIDPKLYERHMEGASTEPRPETPILKMSKGKFKDCKYDINDHLFHSCAGKNHFECIL